MKQNSRIQLENTLIGALGVLSLVLFILSFLPGLGLANRVGILLEMGHMVQRAFSVVLFILTFQLWKRKRAAWFAFKPAAGGNDSGSVCGTGRKIDAGGGETGRRRSSGEQ